MIKITEKYNHQANFLIISDYPEKTKDGDRNYGMAWYTKELVESLAKDHKARFVVLAEKTHNSKTELYQNGRVLVLRVFDQSHPNLFPKILKWLLVFNRITNVHVHSEFCANGGIKNLILLIPFLLLIRLTGRKITYFTHNVITKVYPIAPHLNIKEKSIKTKILNFGLKYYYKTLNFVVDRFVVMDEAIQKRLAEIIGQDKIFLNPFWIKKPNISLSQNEAKRRLGFSKKDFILLDFGFITYYKGADWIIKTFKKLGSLKKFNKITLIMAGGRAYSLKDKKYYQVYYHSLKKLVKRQKNIKITGFIPDKKIGLYFNAADLVVYPYRALIGASGSLTYALAYNKPFIISDKMKDILNNQEFLTTFKNHHLKPKEIIFSHDGNSFKRILSKAMNRGFRNKLINLSKSLAEKRDYKKILSNCYNQLYSHNEGKIHYFTTWPKIILSPNR